MAFICTVDPTSNLIIAKLREGGDAIRQLDVGYDDASGAVLSIFVCLSPLPGQYPDGYELVFSIVEAVEDAEPVFRRDGMETRAYIIERDHRNLVLQAVCLLVHGLVRDERPPKIEFITWEPHLPDKALTKYDMVAHTIASLGYKTGRADPYHGRHIWMMERLDA